MNLDSITKTLDEGRECIQCVEVLEKDNNNLILISIYLPSTGSRDHYEEFKDTIDQLNEIVLKYQDTHYLIIGGDLNEDLGNIDIISKRKDYLEKFVKETGLKYDNEGKTFVKDYTNRPVKWDKVDIDLYVAMTNEQSDSVLNMPLDTLEQATPVLEQVHGFLSDAAATCAANKPRYSAKPKLNVWSPYIKLALDEIR
ncbi:Hypothetical predicted protein [Mytilus galloprovincialis]|uniref:Endonuclease/exonuclease/phosphatase domain-containing protein n=1 Tax=Mytilus galloprovincialis TaxID=29158 RepID=A0A8B6DJ33_MYTGA|nr:Hypothetical predicted protein [Mytilus galloprovincialis]